MYNNRIRDYLTAPIASQYFALDEWKEFEKTLEEYIDGDEFNLKNFINLFGDFDSEPWSWEN